MSLIFSGLQRREITKLEQEEDWDEFMFDDKKGVIDCTGTINAKEIIFKSAEGSQHSILLKEYCAEWEEINPNSIQFFTKNQNFCLNSAKQEILNNVLHYVPRVFYLFKPAYCTQLSMRYIIRMLSGNTNTVQISKMIHNNVQLIKYFVDIFVLSKHIYGGGLITAPMQLSEDLSKQVYGALIELFNLLRNHEIDFPYVTTAMLAAWGDANVLFADNAESNKICTPQCFKRPNNRELCMYGAEFACIICKQYFSSSNELKVHVQEHTKFECLQCNIEFETYEGQLGHTLTFCKVPCMVKNCSVCDLRAEECNCIKIQQQLFIIIQKYIENQNNNNIFQSDMYSSIFHYFCQEADSLALTAFNTDRIINWEEFTNQQIQVVIDQYLPLLECKDNKIISSDWDLPSNFNIIKQIFHTEFSNYQEMECHIIYVSSLLRANCVYTSCKNQYTSQHMLENHSLCPFAKCLDSSEVPERALDNSEYINHLTKHTLIIDTAKCCKICNTQFNIKNNLLSIKEMIQHYLLHQNESVMQVVSHCNETQFDFCARIQFDNIAESMLHNLKLHACSELDIFNCFENIMSSGEKITQLLTPSRATKHISLGNNSAIKRTLFADSEENRPLRTPIKSDNDQKFMAQFMSTLSSGHEETRTSQLANTPQIPGNITRYICFNERHLTKIEFSTSIELEQHLINKHQCPYISCSFYCMMDSEMLTHYKIHSKNIKSMCPVCQLYVLDLNKHLNRDHPKCISCQQHFLDNACLRAHERHCSSLIVLNDEECNEGDSLNLDSTTLEGNFSNMLIRLLKTSQLTKEEITKGTTVIRKFTSESAIAKSRARLENISIRKNDSLFFDVPSFIHNEKSNLTKILSTIGTVSNMEKFDARSEQAKLEAVINFEKLDVIFSVMDKHILIGNLQERQSVNVLQLYFTQRIVDEITSYLLEEWKNLHYAQILSALQFIYVPLDLNLFQNLVLAYRINPNVESFLEFSSRVFRHLKLCSRLKPQTEREDFIDSHRTQILKHSVPTSVLETIIKKEQLYKPFTSQEIIEHVISFQHTQNRDSKQEFLQYRVFSIDNKREKVPVKGQLRSRQKVTNVTEQQAHFNHNNSTQLVNSKQNSKTQMANIKTKPEYISMYNTCRKWNVNTDKTLCFFCLGPHIRRACPIYPLGTQFSPNHRMCIVKLKGKLTPMGFHHKTACKHPKGEMKINSVQAGVQNNAAPSKQFQSNSNPSQSSKVFRPYRRPDNNRK